VWVDGRLKERLKDVAEQLFKVVDYLVLTIHITAQTTKSIVMQCN